MDRDGQHPGREQSAGIGSDETMEGPGGARGVSQGSGVSLQGFEVHTV
jgi:hypothetical protein